jgi:hypothetical protein
MPEDVASLEVLAVGFPEDEVLREVLAVMDVGVVAKTS